MNDNDTSRSERFGAYRIESRLGEGGMGEVFLAWDERLHRHVAIKRIRSDKEIDESTRSRFRREARAVAQLSHPAIVQVFDILEIDEGDCIVMEYIEGRGLREAMAGGLAMREALRIVREIAEGLVEAHRKGLVHRDLKPENVRLTESGQAKILDFGLVRILSADALPASIEETVADLTADGALVGTVHAMAPEQASGRPVDHRADLFSLGGLLYEMLCGKAPFRGENLLRTLDRINNAEPEPLEQLCPELPRPLIDLVQRLLAKDPALRPQNATLVAQEITDLLDEGNMTVTSVIPRQATLVDTPTELRVHPSPELPAQPYPVLLPYTHPALFAGRDRELATLLRFLREPVPIVLLSAASGTGKSSLLLGALVPKLRELGRPTAMTRFPQEPQLARRLIEDLLSGGEPASGESDFATFVERLQETGRLSGGSSPVVVLDQFEEILRTEEARARVGLLLAASLRRGANDQPLCHWVLAVRKEWLGAVQGWLSDVLAEAREVAQQENREVENLPYDLSGSERMKLMLLLPLATVRSGPGALDAAREVFQEAIERPLELRDESDQPLYDIAFAPKHAERLAQAFAESRLTHPEAPLGPELQVVLAHLLMRSTGEIEVPEDPGELIETALEDHLRRSLDAAFPGVDRTGRARALLALRELVAAEGGRSAGLPEEMLTAAIGPRGAEILEKLSSPLTRLVIAVEAPEGLLYVLSHDRLAEVVLHVVEEEGGEGELLVDRGLLSARRVVALKSALFAADEGRVSTHLSRHHFRHVEAHSEAFLCDDARREWWQACQRRRLVDRARWVSGATAMMLLFLLAGFTVWHVVEEQAERRNLLEQVAQGEASSAFAALAQLREEEVTDEELLTALREREKPSVVLEEGLTALAGEERSRAVLATVRMFLPLVEDDPEDFVLIANLLWALNHAPGRDPSFAEEASELHDLVLAPLRKLRPPPPLPDAGDPDWVEIPAGSFWMGTAEEEEGGENECPQHEVTVSAFRLQRHEVTNGEYRRLVPGHAEGEEYNLPVRYVNWYEASTYAAWLGGRLPSEAEWEYAARARCLFAYCDEEGRESTVHAVAWTVRNSKDPETGELGPRPVMRRTPNSWGLYDMLGNVWEWTDDWYVTCLSDAIDGLFGPGNGSNRVFRGGAWDVEARFARTAFRSRSDPLLRSNFLGFRLARGQTSDLE